MTRHSIKRARERGHLSRNAAIKVFENAFEHGKREEELPLREREYLGGKSGGDKIAVYYSGYCFIFLDNGVCITMFRVPDWFLKKTNYDGKVSVRNPRKYFLHYMDAAESY